MRRFFEYLRETVWNSRLKTCVCVAPVHIGLMILAYLQVLVAILQIASLSTEVTIFWPVLAHVSSDLHEGEAPSTLCVLHPATDLVFNGILLAGLHRRDAVLLRVYCWYGLVSLFLAFLIYGLLVALIKSLYFVLIILNGIYQIYVLLLVRSLKIEIELNTANDNNQFMYNKDQGIVIVRDVESPTPRPVILEGYRVLPALPAPEMTTSITTLNEPRPEFSLDSKYDTLNKSNTLKTNTLQSYRTSSGSDDNTQRSATLPHQETVVIHKQINTHKIGAVQSLASPSSLKPLGGNTDTLKTKFSNPSLIFATVEKRNDVDKNKPTDYKKSDENTRSDTATDTEGKDKSGEESKKKKRGFFRKGPKEETCDKDIDIVPKQPISEASTSKSEESKTDNLKKKNLENLNADSCVTHIDKNDKSKAVEIKTDNKKDEIPPKKKRGLFRKQPKEDKNEKKLESEKGNEA